MKYNPLTRRMFLQGAGGFMLAMPVLPSLLPRAEAQAASTSNLRFLLMNNWYGRDYRKWYAHDDKPTTKVTANGGYAYRSLTDLPGDISQILPASVWGADLRKKMTLVRGLDIVDIHDGHNTCAATSGSLEGGADRTYHKFAASIDCVLENSNKFYPTIPRVRAMRSSPTHKDWNVEWSLNNFSWNTVNGRVEEMISYSWPHTLYQKYFSKVLVDQAALRAQRLQVATNSAYADFGRTMSSTKVSAADKQRLDNYMQLLSQAEQKLKVQAQSSGGVCTAPTSAAGLPTDYTKYPNSDALYSGSRDLITAALACGMTKIGVLNQLLLGPDFSRDNPGNDKFHDCAHNPDGTNYSYPALIMNRYLHDHNAAFLKQLDSVQDVDGNTLLDNTLVYIGNDDSTGNHELYDMPVILAGAKNVLRTDMMIDYRNTLNRKAQNNVLLGRPYNNLFISLFKALGLGAETYKVTGTDQKGFGYAPRNAADTKDMKSTIYASHYGQFLTDTEKDAELPYLLLKS